MITKVTLSLIAIFTLSACVATPRIEMPMELSFNNVHYDYVQMSYDDVLCCYDCKV